MEFINLKSQQNKIRGSIEDKIKGVLDHGQFIMGPEVFELEAILAKQVGVKHCISCSSGTDALLILLLANNIGVGDAVLTTPFTYIATSEAITMSGATPVFVDINKDTFNIDPFKIESAIAIAKEKNLKPKAIMPVDLFGLPARYRIISEISNKYNLLIIEDGAQGFGGSIKGKKACSFGDASATSFFPAKPLGCYGDGGAIFTNNDEIANNACSIRSHGQGLDKYHNVRIGLNGRLDTIQAAILLEKFKLFSNEVKLRKIIAQSYKAKISSEYIKQYIPYGYQSVWAQFSLLIPNGYNRIELIKKLKKKGIPSAIYYPIPLHLQRVNKELNYKEGDFPIAEEISKKIISIPMHPYLKKIDQDTVVNALNKIIG
ncbi:MAG: DegT/DnrJ/EryC1/StrS family aminotransferase [Candidatus Neomarinimicrobiota bacterium]